MHFITTLGVNLNQPRDSLDLPVGEKARLNAITLLRGEGSWKGA